MEPTTWCILRTAGRSTLRLAESLSQDGYEVWCPVITEMRKVSRMNVKRRVTKPLFSGLVFARADRLSDLIALAEDPRHRIDFSVFWDCIAGDWARIPDAQLDPLRDAEGKALPKEQIATFGRGQRVRAGRGIYGGLDGTVVRSRPNKTLVIFNEWLRVEINTFNLKLIDDMKGSNAERAPRHRNAAKYLGPQAQVGKGLSGKCEACNDDLADRDKVAALSRS